jgi:hypothetical protein
MAGGSEYVPFGGLLNGKSHNGKILMLEEKY